MSASRSRLEVQLQRQLHQAREVVLAIGEHTENRTGKRGALRSAANRGIGQVEGFGLELEILWSDYQRHDTKQPEKVLEFLKRFDTEIEGFKADQSRIFITGSGGNGMSKYLGAKFVQEVNAVSLAVEKLYPECGSVIELGGQDAKIIIFKKD